MHCSPTPARLSQLGHTHTHTHRHLEKGDKHTLGDWESGFGHLLAFAALKKGFHQEGRNGEGGQEGREEGGGKEVCLNRMMEQLKLLRCCCCSSIICMNGPSLALTWHHFLFFLFKVVFS